MKLQMIATCLFGLEKILGEEIDKLGAKRLDTMDGRVTFEGDPAVLAAANIRLRCAERILIKLGSFPAESFEELFEGTKKLPFEIFVGKNDAFPVKGHAIKSKLFSLPDCQKIIKKAAVSRLSDKYGLTWFPEEGVKYQIEFFIFKDIATIMIDTTGTPLHKRGYRPAAGEAPLRETLAAGIAMTARPREDVLLWDPFCGSGTIAIEAAMLMCGISPGTAREFTAEKFAVIPAGTFEKEREKAASEVNLDSGFEAFASDIDEAILELARANAKRAGVDSKIKIFQKDARDIKKLDRRGTIVCNPPYGERMFDIKTAEDLYRQIGKTFSSLSPWQIYVLTANEDFSKLYGRRPDKIRKLYNGMIPCALYQFFKQR